MNRRTLLFTALVPIGTASVLFFSPKKSASIAKTVGKFEVTKTEAQWKYIDRKL